jgi:hypothetical protein
MYELIMLSSEAAASHVRDLEREAASERQALRLKKNPADERSLASQIRCSVLEFAGVEQC